MPEGEPTRAFLLRRSPFGIPFISPTAVSTRAFDLVSASLLFVLFAPLLALAGLAIYLETGRPLLFTQPRAGQDGDPFRIYKLRTLHTGEHDATVPSAHTTAVGRVLRRWALDELPQLWNVLRGDMSLVGPRPVPLDHLDTYGDYERIRLRVRPGLTGWAQIHGRNALSWPERIDLDVWYVQNRSLALDCWILLRTPIVLMRGRGVYGSGGRNPRPPSSRHSSDASASSSP